MIRKKLAASDTIEAKCTRCKAVFNHTIVAMVEDKVVRVKCNTCGGTHNYHSPKEVKEKASRPASQRTDTAAPRKAKKDSAAALQEEWEALLQSRDRSKAIPYDQQGKFRVNDLTDHPIFGLGVVRTTIKPNKMEVLFGEGLKIMRCAL